MSRRKTKRILWTIAPMVALSLVAGMLLYKPNQPKIIGKLSKEDVAEISKLTLNSRRVQIKRMMKFELKHKDIRMFASEIKSYILLRVTLIHFWESGQATVYLGTMTNEARYLHLLEREDGHWKEVNVLR